MTWDEDRPVVIGLGELLWDVFPDGKRPGGAPANVAYQAQQLGCQGVVVSRVGQDERGDELIAFLEQKGLRTLAIQRDSEAPTGYVTVSFDENHQPSYVIHENVAWDRLEFTDALKQVMEGADAVCFGTLAQRAPTSRQTIYEAVQATPEKCLRVYDINLRQHYFDAAWIEFSLDLATILKLNDAEVDAVAQILNVPKAPEEFAKALIQKFGLELVCITRGSHGCLIVSDQGAIDIPGEPINVADTVGAGDAFTAGLIFSRLRNHSPEESGRFANKIGGIVASHQGAMPDVKAEYTQLINQLGD